MCHLAPSWVPPWGFNASPSSHHSISKLEGEVTGQKSHPGEKAVVLLLNI